MKPCTSLHHTIISPPPQTKTITPLCSFEHNTDYVYDVEWSPVHPALFGCVDGLGKLDIWNINADLEVGVACVHFE